MYNDTDTRFKKIMVPPSNLRPELKPVQNCHTLDCAAAARRSQLELGRADDVIGLCAARHASGSCRCEVHVTMTSVKASHARALHWLVPACCSRSRRAQRATAFKVKTAISRHA
jgi:hypothetical protein